MSGAPCCAPTGRAPLSVRRNGGPSRRTWRRGPGRRQSALGKNGAMSPASYLLILGERKAIYWVLSKSRTAFPEGRAGQASALREGDTLLLYSTRGAWHNPTRDRGRIIGEAKVSSPVRNLRKPVDIAGRQFHSGCRLEIGPVAPYGQGVDLAGLVSQLAMFPQKGTWSVRLRNSIVMVPPADLTLIRERMRAVPMTTVEAALPDYRKAARLGV